MSTTHYSLGQTPKKLREYAKSACKYIKANTHNGQMATLCYTGMSGISHATAISLQLDIPFDMIYVRKVGEKSHGSNIEHTLDVRCYTTYLDNGPQLKSWERIDVEWPKPQLKLFFPDDMICSGKTFKHVTQTIMAWSSLHLLSVDPSVGCILSSDGKYERSI